MTTALLSSVSLFHKEGRNAFAHVDDEPMRGAKHVPPSPHPHRRTPDFAEAPADAKAMAGKTTGRRSAAPWWLRASLAVLFLTPLALAQEKSATVEFRVTRFDPGDGKPPEFRAGQRADADSFEVPLTHIAGPFKATLRDDTFLDLWRGNAEKPEISLRLAPAERTHLLLAFVPEGGSFRVLKIQTPPDRIGGGDRLVINATTGELAFKLGGMKPLHVAPGKSAVLKGPPGEQIVSLPALISQRKEDGWELASTENWPCDPRFRKILFAYFSPMHQHLDFHAVSERIER
jgi:hypothetical protein